MRILLCGEGPHDVGTREWDTRQKDWVVKEGWLQPICRKLIQGSDLEFVATTRKDVVLLPRQQAKHRPLPVGHGAKALAASYIARSKKCDAVIFMADNDSPDTSEWRSKTQQIEEGFRASDDGTPGIPCVPMSTSECWLLADSSAWGHVEAKGLPNPPVETLWGTRNDPESDHPKQVFARVCNSLEFPDDRETRRAVAEAVTPANVEDSCPTSFGGFRAKLSSL